MSGPSVHFSWPPKSLFKFPPDPQPPALPPPSGDVRWFAAPFTIDAKTYNDFLVWWVPVTIASVYFLSVKVLNRVNKRRGYKPWSISQQKGFKYFVLIHNIGLAIFSGLTFVALTRALRHTWPSRRDVSIFGLPFPGIHTENGVAGAADALCKLHGPRGFGDAVYYNNTLDAWQSKNRWVQLGELGLPDTADLGRVWNEGLAFWGWFFYLSKFYEVLDTFIILAKGKRSATLQTYHHTGAMLCMWAGIRYMSPPIWMFCFINSGIHTLMVCFGILFKHSLQHP